MQRSMYILLSELGIAHPLLLVPSLSDLSPLLKPAPTISNPLFKLSHTSKNGSSNTSAPM